MTIKIHYRNRHGKTNLPWQGAFRKLGDLSLGSEKAENFPDEIDHLHLGGSCKTKTLNCENPITVDVIKEVQRKTNCSISCFFGDAWEDRFQFHHELLDCVPKVKVYSAALYGTSMWRDDIEWVLHPTDEELFHLVNHKKNDKVLFCGSFNLQRREIVQELNAAGIEVDVCGIGGNISPRYGKALVELSKNYSISIGMLYDTSLPQMRYSSSRLPNALAMGLIYIETNFDLEGVFENNEIIQWKNLDDLINKIFYYQNNPEEGLEIIMRGRKKVLENWTFSKLAKRFLREGEFEK